MPFDCIADDVAFAASECEPEEDALDMLYCRGELDLHSAVDIESGIRSGGTEASRI